MCFPASVRQPTNKVRPLLDGGGTKSQSDECATVLGSQNRTTSLQLTNETRTDGAREPLICPHGVSYREPTLGAHIGSPHCEPSLGALIGSPHWEPTLGALIGCPHWERTLGAHIGCPHWERTLGAHIGCPHWVSAWGNLSGAHIGCPHWEPTL